MFKKRDYSVAEKNNAQNFDRNGDKMSEANTAANKALAMEAITRHQNTRDVGARAQLQVVDGGAPDAQEGEVTWQN